VKEEFQGYADNKDRSKFSSRHTSEKLPKNYRKITEKSAKNQREITGK
jgi:hypothetical protein